MNKTKKVEFSVESMLSDSSIHKPICSCMSSSHRYSFPHRALFIYLSCLTQKALFGYDCRLTHCQESSLLEYSDVKWQKKTDN